MPQHEFITKQLIDKGWSEDRKYCVTDEQGNKFLLRVSPIEQYDRKKSEYELMGQVAALGVPMCRPLEFGTFDEGVYSIQTWIDGIDAEENIHNLTNQEQYSYQYKKSAVILSELRWTYGGGEESRTPVRKPVRTAFYECSCSFNIPSVCRRTAGCRLQ